MKTIAPNTFAAVIRAYQGGAHYRKLAPATRNNYNRALRAAETPEALGALQTDAIRPALVLQYLDQLASIPGQQRTALTALRAVEAWAVPRDYLPRQITSGISMSYRGGGHAPWSDEQVALAETHARPDLARAVTLAAHTGQRGSDLVRMRWSDIQAYGGHSGIVVQQQKTKLRLWIPFTAQLEAILPTWERKPPFFLLLDPRRKPFTRESLSWAWNKERARNKLLEPLEKAGLVMHGLRATAVVRARKAGASVLHIASMYGMSEPLVARYSRLADQSDMALAALVYLDRAKPLAQQETNTLSRSVGGEDGG